jgi:adenine-specific DNA methylase
VDECCSDGFRASATAILREHGLLRQSNVDANGLRAALLDLIGAISDRKAAEDQRFLRPARLLVGAAAKELGEEELVLADPFAGGGAIPVEALRLGVRAVASDLNPIPVVLNRLLVEAVPRYGAGKLSEVIEDASRTVETRAKARLAEVHPAEKDGRAIAYLWARTIRCEGPGCGVELPLVRSYWLDKKSPNKARLQLTVKDRDLDVSVAQGAGGAQEGIMRGGSATCPSCGFTTANAALRAQLATRRGGARDARLLAVVTTDSSGRNRRFRSPTAADNAAFEVASERLAALSSDALPTELVSELRPSPNARGLSAITRIGVREFQDLFTARQAYCLAVFLDEIHRVEGELAHRHEKALVDAVVLGLAAALGRCADHWNSCCTWNPTGLKLQQMFKRQAIPVVWDFCEANPFGGSVGSWESAVECVTSALKNAGHAAIQGTVLQADAGKHPLPDDTVDILFTDPPYYDSVPYADLSDFFYVWHKRLLRARFPDIFDRELTPKDEEAIWNPSRTHTPSGQPKNKDFYEAKMRCSLAEARRITKPSGIGIVVFAHKSTAGWEAILSALVNAGWVATASWPLDTELGTRMNAMGTASLASSVHIVCRPREAENGDIDNTSVGDWRQVLRELPTRMHEWLPRLASEGIVGADAIFACLGPALEIFSKHARVEKVSGEVVELKEYLEQVWAAVSKEALSMIFNDADTAGLEEDARLTAMWLWTLVAAPTSAESSAKEESDDDDSDEGDEDSKGASAASGFTLEFDTARKIAQGLGARLDELTHVAEIKGDKARLLAVVERTKHLFGKAEGAPTAKKAGKKKQMTLFGELEEAAEAQGWGEVGAPKAATTTLDRVHQAMLLFGSGRGEALKRFLVEEGVGKQPQFWKLAQSLSALYPGGTDEKRWVDGVLARKKGLGF